MIKKVIGFDVSTITGVSIMTVINKEINNVTYEIEFKKLKGIQRVSAFYNAFDTLLENQDPELVIIEGYGYASNNIVPSVEIGTALRLCCYNRNIPYHCIAPTALKKFVTGKGNSPKEVMMMTALKRWGFEAKTNNEADAYGLARIGLMVLNHTVATNAYEREMLLTLQGDIE